MKKTLSPLLCALTLAAPAAHASVVNLQFTAKVSGISVYDSQSGANPVVTAEQSAYIGDDLITSGERFVGNFTYDPDTPYAGEGYTGDVTNTAQYAGPATPNRMSLFFDGGHTFTSLPNWTSILIFNNAAYTDYKDVWNVWAGNGNSNLEYAIWSIQDPSGQMYSDISLAMPSFDPSYYTGLNLNYYDATTGRAISIVADLDSLQQIPEPATLATITAGLGMLAALRRRKTPGSK